MNKQAQVGLFTILGLVAVFAVFFVLSDFGTRARGYKIGVHFAAASGLRDAAVVYLSGVPIGAVDSISLLKDYSTEVVLAIDPGYEIPVGSRFIIQAPITGEPTILIEPPKVVAASAQTLPHEVLPIEQQPAGTNPASFADLLEQGQGEIRRVDNLLAQLQQSEPVLLGELKATLSNANALTANANRSLTSASSQVAVMTESLQKNLTAASNNVVDLTGTLDGVVRRDSGQVDVLLTQLTTTSKSFGETVDSLHGIATDPKVKANLINTTRDFALTAHTFALLTDDFRKVTNNAQTQNQLRDTVAQIDATSQKVDSLVGQLGGTSKVYGIDAGASPAPAPSVLPPGQVPTSQPILQSSPTSDTGSGTPAPGGATAMSTAAQGSAKPGAAGLAALRARLNQFTKDLVQLQIRASDLAPLRPGSAGRNVSPLLTSDRGPESDVNMFVLPHAHSGLELGVNDIGSSGTSTANALILSRTNGFSYGGGIEYSRLGVVTSIGNRAFSLETRAYDLRHPTLDQYINLILAPKFQIFGGERDLTHASRRTTFGLQFEL
jgi:ABC-type transporter Mla subunit MlaD